MVKIEDSDTGESEMDVVAVPEGFSFQIAQRGELEYVSVICSRDDAYKLVDFLMEELNK